MSKKNVFFSLFLLVLSVCFITDVKNVQAEELNENSQNVLQTEDTASRWDAAQPERITTSEGLIIDYNFDDFNAVVGWGGWIDEGYVTVTITIPENYELDTIVIAPDVFQEIADYIYAVFGDENNNFEMNNTMQAGDKINVNFVINNLSKYTYNYDETSFEVFPKEDIIYDKVNDEENTTSEDTPVFNGDIVNDNYHFRRTYNTALKALIPNSNGSKMTDDVIGNALISKGYLNGMADYTKYLLDFYNAKYNTNYTRLDQFPDGIIREILGENDPFLIVNDAYRAARVTYIGRSDTTEDILRQINRNTGKNYQSLEEYIVEYYNEQYGTNATRLVDLSDDALDNFFSSQGMENGGYVYETNPDVIALSYDYFYNKGLAWGFEDDEYTHDDSEDLAIGEYMRDEVKGDDYIKENAGTLNSNTSDYTLNGTLYTSGNYLLDSYLGYEFNVNMQWTYSALKGTVIAKYVDIYGNVLGEDVITTDMVGKDYKTYLKYFDGYTLYTIDGEETGKYIDGTIVVTYIYEPTDDEPGTGFTPGPSEELEITPPNTGVETESQNMYLVILLILSSICLYRYASNKE